MKRFFFSVFFLFSLAGSAKDWNGVAYQKNNFIQDLWAFPLLEKITLSGNERILDLGCGDGNLTKKLAARVPNGKVVGLDLSADMIETARNSIDDVLKDRLSYVVGDATQFELDEQFDVIVSFTALHWVRDQDAVVRQAAKHLKPGGRLYFMLPVHFDLFSQLMQTRTTISSSPKYAAWLSGTESNLHLHSVDAYMRRLLENDFRLHEISVRPKDTTFGSREIMLGWLSAWLFGEYKTIPAEKHNEFANDFLDIYLSQPGAVDERGNGHWYAHFMEVVATKATTPR